MFHKVGFEDQNRIFDMILIHEFFKNRYFELLDFYNRFVPICNQIFFLILTFKYGLQPNQLNLFVEDCQFGYIMKLKKKKNFAQIH